MTEGERVAEILAQLRVLLAPAPLGEGAAVRVEDWSAWTDEARDGYFMLKQELTLETVHVSDAERLARLRRNIGRLLPSRAPDETPPEIRPWAVRWTEEQRRAFRDLRDGAALE